MSTHDELREAFEASSAADMRVRAFVRAIVYGHDRRDSARMQKLVQERNAAFGNFLQTFIRRSRSMAARAPDGKTGDQA